MTQEQYLEIERSDEYKSEYYAGEMVAMPAVGRAHNVIVSNIIGELRQQLRTRPLELYANRMRVLVRATGLYTYPDIVACEQPRFTDTRVDTLLNPIFLAEVLSPSTEGYDRGRKFEHYRTIDSLAEYLLVAQDRMHVDLYTRQPDGHWLLSEASRPEDTIELRSIGCRLVLADIYEKVSLSPTLPPPTAP